MLKEELHVIETLVEELWDTDRQKAAYLEDICDRAVISFEAGQLDKTYELLNSFWMVYNDATRH